MKIKYSTINAFILIIAVTVQAFTANVEEAGFISMLKYLICCIGIAYSIIVIKRKTKVFKYELNNVIIVSIVFLIISLIKVLVYGNFISRTFYELFFLLLPVTYAYFILNTLSYKIIERSMFAILVICFIGYLVSLKMSIPMILTGLRTMSFSNSYSMLESHSFAGISIALALYYLYFRKNKMGMILSVLFVIMTFKRLAVITVIILIFLPKFIDSNKKVNKRILNVAKISIFVIGVLYFWAMVPSNLVLVDKVFNIDLKMLTMGRTYRFLYAYNGIGFRNGGLGATYTYLMNNYQMSLEMEICKLILEVTPVGVAVFINNFYNTAKENVYCFIVMTYLFFNMITSHCLTSVFSWLIIYITFGMIEYKQYEVKR